ncbi:hypothetical protein EV122DRAFT_294849 [Schizophyllum commune]
MRLDKHSTQSTLERDTSPELNASPQSSTSMVSSTTKLRAAKLNPTRMKVIQSLRPTKVLRAFFPSLARHHNAKFSDLPVDILMTILAMLDPLEILLVRYSCKAAYMASRQRWVWLQVLQNHPPPKDATCLLPAHYWDTAAAPDLERLATFSLLWPLIMKAAINRKSHQRRGWLYPRRQIPIPAAMALEQGGLPPAVSKFGTPDITLLPGGHHFLVESSQDKKLRLCELSLDEPQVKEIASLSIDSGPEYQRVDDHTMTEDGRLVRVLITEKLLGSDDEGWFYSVYEAALDDPSPGFRLYARKRCPFAFPSVLRTCVAIGRDCIVCADYRELHLMSLTQDKHQTWIYNAQRSEWLHTQKVRIIGSHVILTTKIRAQPDEPPRIRREELMHIDTFERKDASVFYPMRFSLQQPFPLFVHSHSRDVWGTEVFHKPTISYQLGSSLALYQIPTTPARSRSQECLCFNAFQGRALSNSGLAYYSDGEGVEIRLSLPFADGEMSTLNGDLSTSFDLLSGRFIALRKNGTLEVIDYL